MRDHTNLRAFELADEMVLLIYRATREFPKEEIYGLTSQMRRAGISVSSNNVDDYVKKWWTDQKSAIKTIFEVIKITFYYFGGAFRSTDIPSEKSFAPALG